MPPFHIHTRHSSLNFRTSVVYDIDQLPNDYKFQIKWNKSENFVNEFLKALVVLAPIPGNLLDEWTVPQCASTMSHFHFPFSSPSLYEMKAVVLGTVRYYQKIPGVKTEVGMYWYWIKFIFDSIHSTCFSNLSCPVYEYELFRNYIKALASP